MDKKDHDFYYDAFGWSCKTDADVVRVAEGVLLKLTNVIDFMKEGKHQEALDKIGRVSSVSRDPQIVLKRVQYSGGRNLQNC
jgi:hypothetical protein